MGSRGPGLRSDAPRCHPVPNDRVEEARATRRAPGSRRMPPAGESDGLMDLTQRESAIIVPIRLPAALAELRLRETRDGPAGVPGHVTLLYPFVPPGSIDGRVLVAVAAVIARAPSFDIRFREVRRWGPGGGASEGVVWLEPEPSAPFNELTRALFAAFPACPPYGGMHDETIAHVSLAAIDRRHQDAVETEARRWLPFRRRVSTATLIVEGEDGRWRTRRRFALGAGSR